MKRKAYVAVYDHNSNEGNQGETILASDVYWTKALELVFDSHQLLPGQFLQGWYSDANQVTCMAYRAS